MKLDQLEAAASLKDLPLQIYLFAGILIALLVPFLLFFVVPGLLLRNTLQRLTKQIRRLWQDREDRAQLSERDKALKHLWLEFRKTLHEQKELNTQTGQRRYHDMKRQEKTK